MIQLRLEERRRNERSCKVDVRRSRSMHDYDVLGQRQMISRLDRLLYQTNISCLRGVGFLRVEEDPLSSSRLHFRVLYITGVFIRCALASGRAFTAPWNLAIANSDTNVTTTADETALRIVSGPLALCFVPVIVSFRFLNFFLCIFTSFLSARLNSKFFLFSIFFLRHASRLFRFHSYPHSTDIIVFYSQLCLIFTTSYHSLLVVFWSCLVCPSFHPSFH